MKRFIVFFVIAAMVSALCPAGAFAGEDSVSVSYVFENDFNSELTGSQPETGTVNQFNNKVYVAEVPDASDKSLKYEVVNDVSAYYQFNVTGVLKNFICEFDIQFEVSGNGELRVCFKDSAQKEVQVMYFDKNRNLCLDDGTALASLSLGKKYRICMAVSLENHTADIWLNHKKKASGVKLNPNDFGEISIFRLHLYKVSAGGTKPVIYFDNIKAYELDKPIFKYEYDGADVEVQESSVYGKSGYIANEKEVASYMKNTVALYTGQNRIAVDGEVSQLDPLNSDVKAYVENGRTFVPIRFVSEAMGYDVKYDESTKSAVINNDGHTLTFTADRFEYMLDGESKQNEAPARIVSDRLFVPVRAIAEGFDRKVTYDKSGLIVIADREEFFDYQEDLPIFRKLAGDLVFDNPGGEKIISLVKERYPNNKHPRLLINDEKLASIKYGIETNETMAKWAAQAIKNADYLLDAPLLKYESDNDISIGPVTANINRVETFAFAYLLTNDNKYAERCWQEMDNVSRFKDWNPFHFLDVGMITDSMALGYDWLYNWMNEAQRTQIRDTLHNFGLKEIVNEFNGVDRGNRYYWVKSEVADNWNLVCNGGTLMAALAIGDEAEAEETAVKALDGGMELLQKAILVYGPDGAWFEGPSYWRYGTQYYADFMGALDTACGQNFDYTSTPGISEAGYYINAMVSSGGNFNIHDADTGHSNNAPTVFYLASKFDDPVLGKIRLNMIDSKGFGVELRDVIWFDYTKEYSEITLPLDFYFRDTEVAIMRGSWKEDSSVYVGFHAGTANGYHAQIDVGQFIIDAYGTRYAADLGKDNYLIPDSTWNLYRYRAEGHNNIVLNPGKDGGQLVYAGARIDKTESNNGSSYAIMDMSDVYAANAKSAVRGMKLFNNRTTVLVQDEVKTAEPAELYWFMHSAMPITVSADGKSAVVTGRYRDMYVYLLADIDGTFSVMDASPLETSPQNNAQDKNINYKKLAFHTENVTDLTLPILFTFEEISPSELEEYKAEVCPLDSWTLDEDVDSEKLPELTDLRINGQTIEGFDSEKLSYSYKIDDGEAMPTVEAEGTGKITVEMPESAPGRAVVTAEYEGNSKIRKKYVIQISKNILLETPKGTDKKTVTAVTASSVPEAANIPENTLDGDLNTRWSAEYRADITYDLGDVYTISHVGLAIYQDVNGDGRCQFFEVYTSEDGVNYNWVYSGESTGTTLEEEIFPVAVSKARYIKIDCKGTTRGNWNSITEFNAYGPTE